MERSVKMVYKNINPKKVTYGTKCFCDVNYKFVEVEIVGCVRVHNFGDVYKVRKLCGGKSGMHPLPNYRRKTDLFVRM